MRIHSIHSHLLTACFIAFSVLSPSYLSAASIIKQIVVDPEYERNYILNALPFREGGGVDKPLLEMADRLLKASERFEGVSVRFDEADGVVRITVNPIDYVQSIQWSGNTIVDRGGLERKCVRTSEALPLSQERLSEINRCMVQELQSRSFLDASVIIQQPEGKHELAIEVLLGPSYQVRSVSLSGIGKYDERELKRRIALQEAKPFFPEKLKADTETITEGMLKWGYLFAQVFQPVFEIDSTTASVGLTWKIDPGQRFDLRFLGQYTGRKYINALISRKETLPKWFLDEIQDSIVSDARQDGYLDAEVVIRRKKISTDTELIKVVTIKGRRYLVTEPEWVGATNLTAVRRVFQDYSELAKGEPFNRERYRKTILEDMGNALYESGYLDLQIRGVDFNVNRETARVTPVIYLTEGDLYLIDQVEINGLEPFMQSMPEWKDLNRILTVSKTYFETITKDAQVEFKSALVRLGYLDADVNLKTQRDKGLVLVSLNIKAGPAYRIGSLLVRGAKRTDPDMLRQESGLEAGEPYTEEAVRDGISNILRLGLARSLDIRVIEKVPETGLVYVLIDLVESARFRFEVGPGYGTLDGLRGVFKGTYANIAGTGRRLSFFAKANRKLKGTEVPTDVLDPREVPFIQRRITVEYFEPRVFGTPVDGRVTFSNLKQSFPQFSDFRNILTTSFDYRLSRSISLTTEYEYEYSDPFNVSIGLNTPLFDERAKTLTSLAQSVRWDYLDDNLNPIRGVRSVVKAHLYNEAFLGDANFWQTTGKQNFFVPLYQFKKTRVLGFATALNGGFSDAMAPTSEIPVNKRYYVGGENSVRGFDDQSINPPNRVGGNSYFYFQSEVNVPLVSGMDFLTFFDGGNLYAENRSFKPWDLRYGAGAGLRLNTPVGPLKVGYGFNILRRHIEGKREPLGAFYFGVGVI